MTSSEFAAESLIRLYLFGRRLPKTLHNAVVWVVARRLREGENPVLDETLRSDIDNQAAAP